MRYDLVVSFEHVNRLTYVQEKSQGWVSAEVNVLTFTYLLTFSLPESSKPEALESLIAKATKLAHMSPDNHDVGFLVVYSLLNLHDKVVSQQSEDTNASDGVVRNSRLLLQATMLARALVERDAEKQNRKLGLISARLHLNLGLGKTAFRQWRHAKCKEMLIDTLSPYLLSRISQTHPFDVRGHQGFAADKELDYTISTIERMEDKQEELLFSSIKRFLWDSAIDQLRFKGKLRSSLTKNMCAIERRRIARLKGEPAGDLPEIDYSSKFGNCTHSVRLDQADFDRLPQHLGQR
jgi:N-terminal acetyltransferase B complex non-catalytic subunit